MAEFFRIVFGPESSTSDYPRYMYWLQGISFTLQLALLAAIIGIILGIIIALCKLSNIHPFKFLEKKNKFKRISKFNPVSFLATIYIDIIRGTPVMVQIMIINFVVFAQSDIPKLLVGAIAFGLNSGAYVSEIIRAGIQSLDKGQMEAARSLGMPYGMAMRHIIIPQAIKNILPALVSEFIILLKETSVISFIAGFDIIKAANTIISQSYTAAYPLYTAAGIYLILTTIFTTFMRKVERGMKTDDRRA